MLRRALPSLFCAFALVAPAYSQDVFVPRELKAQAVHPPKEHKPEAKSEKPKETVHRAETVADAESKPSKESASTADTAAKPKSPKTEKIVAKTDKPAAPKEKAAPAKDDLPTIKVEKTATAKEPAAVKTVAKTDGPKEKKDKVAPEKEKAEADTSTIKVAKVAAAKFAPAKEKADKPKEKSKEEKSVAKSEKAPAKDKSVAKSDEVKVETVTTKTEKEKPAAKDHPATVAASKSLKEEKSPAKEEPKVSKNEPAKTVKSEATVAKNEPAPPREGPVKALPTKSEMVSVPSQKEPPQIIPAMSSSLDSGFTRIADGFDFPVGKPDAEGYYKARGFRPGGHVGEDWDGVRGGDTDLGDPIYAAGDGIVVFARDVHLGWGNVVILRHAYRDGGNVKYIDSLYGHLQKMLVSRGQRVSRGQQIATMGTAHGQYDAHLHFEIRKNLEIGMSRSKFQKDFNNYFDPTQFINSHRHLSGGGANYKVAMNTFTHDWEYHFDKNRDFASRKRSTSQSAAALRAALTSR
ncbi:MAG TPA: peptidoglycan DD-metalloendopeptidase family protein [Chthoniobacterales bacterium]|jgi:murein DD-endopeptidase MepM/ murein hydrolase activator NlpD|nr:peptidoglycan DD-metalloendopeptidase family protein [Chthoniobacterales bacterium]